MSKFHLTNLNISHHCSSFHAGNPRIFISRLASFSKPEKIPDIEAKPKSALNLNWWININDFVPPPPR